MSLVGELGDRRDESQRSNPSDYQRVDVYIDLLGLLIDTAITKTADRLSSILFASFNFVSCNR